MNGDGSRPPWSISSRASTCCYFRSPKHACACRRARSAIFGRRRADPADHDDLLSLLLLAEDADNGAQMNDEQIRSEVMMLFAPGLETTANALAFALHLLGAHPEAATRHATKPGALRDPREGLVMMPPYLIHRDANLWPDPERFDLDRWGPEGMGPVHRYADIPFGAGTRKCIGSSFAIIEGTLILATIAQRVGLLPHGDAPLELLPQITLRTRPTDQDGRRALSS